MESTRRSPTGIRRAVAWLVLGVLAIGSLAAVPPPEHGGASRVWQFARVGHTTLPGGLSVARPGEVAAIRFSLGAFRGSDIFVWGAPVSARIGCASRDVADRSSGLDRRAHGTLDYDAERGIYTYLWVTSEAWSGTCRRLSLEFADGSSHDVLVWFGLPPGVAAEPRST